MAELYPLLSVRRHLLQRALGAARASRREGKSAGIQHVNGHAESSADASEQMVCRHLQSLVTQLGLCRAANPELAHRPDHAKTGHVRTDEKRCRALNRLTATLHERLGESRNHSGAMPITNPDLSAIETPVRPVLGQRRGSLDVLRVGADLGLSQRVGSEKISPSESRQIPLLLLIVAVENDRL